MMTRDVSLASFEEVASPVEEPHYETAEILNFPVSAIVPEPNPSFAAVIEWYGPYPTRVDAITACKKWGIDEGFYLVIGRSELFPRMHLKLKAPLWVRALQYIGVSNKSDGGVAARLRDHHKISHLSPRDLEIWIGRFAQPFILEENVSKLPADLDQTEWALIQSLKPVLNEQKAGNTPPTSSVYVRNHFFDIEGNPQAKSCRWRPEIIDYPNGRLNNPSSRCFHLYWLDTNNQVKRRKVVPVGPSNPKSYITWADRMLSKLQSWLIALFLGLLMFFGLWLNRGLAEDFIKSVLGNSGVAVDSGRVEYLMGEIKSLNQSLTDKQSIIQTINRELSGLKTQLSAALSENSELKTEVFALEEKVEGLLEDRTHSGLDEPPCWRRDGSRNPDYLFNATISDDGIKLEKAFRDKTDVDYQQLPVSTVPLNKYLRTDAFRQAVSPIYQHSVSMQCRHFVRLYEGQHSNLNRYKMQRAAIEQNFYIFRP